MSLKLFLRTFFFFLIACCFQTTIVLAEVSIRPAFLKIDLNQKRANGAFTITNTGDKPHRYRIMSSHFIFTETGMLKKIKPDADSLATWVKFNPKEFTLPPKSNRNIRYTLIPRGKIIPKKEYWGAMQLASLDKNIVKGRDEEKNIGFSLDVQASVLVPIFASKGEPSHKLSFKEFHINRQDNNDLIQFTIKNKGGGRLTISGKYQVVDNGGSTVVAGDIKAAYILSGKHRIFSLPISPDSSLSGDYTIKIDYIAPQISNEPVTETLKHRW